MPVQALKQLLDENRVKYVTVTHSLAYTAQEIAASAHIPGRELAKTTIVKVDGKLAMAVLPASHMVHVKRLKEALGAHSVELANESEFRHAFPGCELGAMPPFGSLYGMDVYVEQSLTEDEEIAFNAGSHTELIRMGYADFAKLAKPEVIRF
jgi:Ala-tRNA(Pro) deacylase